MLKLNQTINSFSFAIDGLKLSYSQGDKKTTLSFDALSTCDLFTQMGFIEGFDLDANREPVILYTDANLPNGYCFELWSDFVKSFPKEKRIAEMILEYRKEKEYFKQLRQFVNYNRYLTFHPKKTAA